MALCLNIRRWTESFAFFTVRVFENCSGSEPKGRLQIDLNALISTPCRE